MTATDVEPHRAQSLTISLSLDLRHGKRHITDLGNWSAGRPGSFLLNDFDVVVTQAQSHCLQAQSILSDHIMLIFFLSFERITFQYLILFVSPYPTSWVLY